jgi:hypothetical protein
LTFVRMSIQQFRIRDASVDWIFFVTGKMSWMEATRSPDLGSGPQAE